MAEIKESTAIVPMDGVYNIVIKDYPAEGGEKALTVPIPGNLDYRQWSILARAAVLKQTTWAKFSVPAIILAIVFADKLGLDIELGDVYSTDGRPAISAEGRIKLAMKTGLIEGIKTEWRELDEQLGKPKCVLKKDIECTVTMKVKGWDEPLVRKARLSRWYKDTPAWNDRPEHQLEFNLIGHTSRFVSPVSDPADAPPLADTAKNSS